MSIQQIHHVDGRYRYFLELDPMSTVGYSIYIYHISVDEANRLRRTMGFSEIIEQKIKPEYLLDQMIAARKSSRLLNVALFIASDLKSVSQRELRAAIASAENLVLTIVSEEDIRDDALDKYDVLVVPGGKASVQGSALGATGRKAIRDFVRRGGGYVGICAGARLAAVNHDWSLNLVNARTSSGMRFVAGRGIVSASFRGWGEVCIALTHNGHRLFGAPQDGFSLDYTGGPVFTRANEPQLPDYVPLASFRSEVWRYPFQQGTMIDTAAVLASRYANGDIILFSPHPESTEQYMALLTQAIRACAKQTLRELPQAVQ